ncbi:hypothetical protein OGAPHI_000899 [Ogataea philodendri]|uniref:Major facilitator superfamily (MFS) profile domain-containing protein n=1 Tax=Ogataea philodendri TaxID=1378263 RepID=A0A9P8T9B1_9ASCO|nr:uncharacterized protein OGAPHI_000899 [Ogataea philodendri]KAH3670384.1 hypothetical protein OGAPHI_000899 [Ogataea philodendri]
MTVIKFRDKKFTDDFLLFKSTSGESIICGFSSMSEKEANEHSVEYLSSTGAQDWSDVDQAMQLANESKKVVIDEKRDRAVLRKLDFYLMPLVSFLYALFYIDKACNGYAAVMGIQTDMNMKGNQYSWTSSAFYLGYLCFQPFAGYTLQRFPLSRTFSLYMLSWAVIICLQASNSSYAAFTFLRTLLGCSEASASVFTTLLTSQYYRKKEAFLRVSFWLSTSGFGIVFGSLMSYGIAIRADQFTIESWKVLFIVVGLISLVIGIIVFFHIPNTPAEAWFLSKEEKLVVVERIRENYQGFGNKKFKKQQCIEALLDPKTWLFFLYAIAFNIPNGGIASFGSILLHSDLGYSSTTALLYGVPQGIVEFVGLPIIAYTIQKLNWSRLLTTSIVIICCISFSCMLAFGKENHVKLAGYLLLSFMQIGPIGCFSYFASNVPGHTKKITVTGIYLIGYCVGNLVGPQTYRASDAPHYVPAKIAIVVCLAVSAACLLAIFTICMIENKKRDKNPNANPELAPENIEFSDLTDKENIFFRYTL